MARAIAIIAGRTAVAAVLAFGSFLIGYDVLKGIDWRWDELLCDGLSSLSEALSPGAQDEVRNFVLFTHVSKGDLTITTGVQYTSTSNRMIDRQWCYVSRTEAPGEAALWLDLARVLTNGELVIETSSPSALSAFSLTDRSARALVKSHCRFQ